MFFFLTTLSMNALLRSTTPRSTSTLRQRRRTRSQGRGCSTWRGSRLRSWRATPQPWPPPTTAACQAWPEKSWRVRAQRPWCWLHHCHPHTPPYYHCHHRLPHCHTTVGEHKHQDPGAGLTNFRLPGQKARSEGWSPHSKLFKEILNTNFHLKALPHNNEEVDREKKSDSASKLKKKIKFAFKNKNRKMRVCV